MSVLLTEFLSAFKSTKLVFWWKSNDVPQPRTGLGLEPCSKCKIRFSVYYNKRKRALKKNINSFVIPTNFCEGLPQCGGCYKRAGAEPKGDAPGSGKKIFRWFHQRAKKGRSDWCKASPSPARKHPLLLSRSGSWPVPAPRVTLPNSRYPSTMRRKGRSVTNPGVSGTFAGTSGTNNVIVVVKYANGAESMVFQNPALWRFFNFFWITIVFSFERVVQERAIPRHR